LVSCGANQVTPALAELAPAVAPTRVAMGGVDVPECGSEGAPCGTLRYAINVLGNAAVPSDVFAVVLGPGEYGQGSCGANATRPVRISGAGSSVTVVNCHGTSTGCT
jgi:hypothetical protein